MKCFRRFNMVKITNIAKKSVAERYGIQSGDWLISINGNEINDLFDYKFYISENSIVLSLKKADNQDETTEIAIKKPKYSDIGLEFASYMMDEKKSCNNKCVFCFIDQLPNNPKLRDTLYFKDDDERLSFLHGNYITLTNLEEYHIDRIIKMRISPINISVHTTNPELRCKMMNNKRAGKTLEYIKKLADNNISLNTQIVLCKNLNDKHELEQTLNDLRSFYPAMRSIAIVPAGMTKYREQNALYPLEAFNKTDCREVIELCNNLGEENINKYGGRLIYCSDEFFLKADINIPPDSYYEDYPQIENGVGMLRNFITEFYDACDSGYAMENKKEDNILDVPKKISLATGVAAYPVIKTLIDDLMGKYKNLDCTVYCIENDFFGTEVTVAGLITGGDLIKQLLPHKKNLGEKLLIPSVMLRYERDLFLDSVSVDDVAQALDIEVVIVENNAKDLIEKIL